MEKISRQVKRAQERKEKKELIKIVKKLQLSNFEYVADDKNVILSALSPQLVDFLNVLGLSDILKEHVDIKKRESIYSSPKLSSLLILQNILGYDRIENTQVLDNDKLLKEKLGIENYPDPETFRDELARYTEKNIDQLFLVNQKILDIICKTTKPQYVDLHFDAKIITVYGDQEKAEIGYNPHKKGRKSYHLKVCTVEPFGLILAIRLDPGDAVSSTDFIDFYNKSLAAVPQNHLVVKTVRLDSGFFNEDIITSFEGDYLFFEVVAKKYKNIKEFIASIPEEEFKPFYPDERIDGASFSFDFKNWDKPRDFVVVRKEIAYEKDGQGIFIPKKRYQVICHNQVDMSPKEVWEDYNKRCKIELNIRDLDYDHFITKVPTGNFLSNFAYAWHCVFAHNLMLIFRNYLLPEEWATSRTSTIRKKLINIPGRLVNYGGKMVMRLISGFPFIDVFNFVKEQLICFFRKLNPLLC
jgi:hypothetical protein